MESGFDKDFFEKWLKGLPTIEQSDDDVLTIESFLLSSSSDFIRIILSNLCLTFNSEDVISIKEIKISNNTQKRFAIPVCIKLRKGARLMEISSSIPFQDFIPKDRTPFAIRTRQDIIVMPPSLYLKIANDFLKKKGYLKSIQGILESIK